LSHYQAVLTYHQQTKHHVTEGFAAAPHTLDWQAQPCAFRQYSNTYYYELPLTAQRIHAPYEVLHGRISCRPRALNTDSIASLLELSLGLSAWKQFESQRWPLRCYPSSGNLHPVEGYLVTPDLVGLPAGVYHYNSHNHDLAQRGRFDVKCAETFAEALPANTFLIGLTIIPWRESWKYGERAFRYCHHDVGHVMASIRYAASCLGWEVVMLSHWADDETRQVLGLHRHEDFHTHEEEYPALMLWVTTQPHKHTPRKNPNMCTMGGSGLLRALHNIHWYGKAEKLSLHHDYHWQMIDDIIQATEKPVTHTPQFLQQKYPFISPLVKNSSYDGARQLIHQRRSAQCFDAHTQLADTDFYTLLDYLLPRQHLSPWSVFPSPSCLHLVFFVHRVTGLESGVYILIRDKTEKEYVQAQLHPHFNWQRPKNCPHSLAFYQLSAHNNTVEAHILNCYQDIASDGIFTITMLAKFEQILYREAWRYKHLFWEAGLIGQVLYLQAEQLGLRGTGIGCYFDDMLHDFLGIKNMSYQSIYHFSVGGALEDKRLHTLAPYAHLNQAENKNKP